MSDSPTWSMPAGAGEAAPMRAAFSERGWAALEQRTIDAGDVDLPGLSPDDLPVLVTPAEFREPHVTWFSVVVAVEGADRNMAMRIVELLDPTRVDLRVVHVTWVPGTTRSPLPADGQQNPEPLDLLAYRGAHEALIDTSGALREAGFRVTTVLCEGRYPGREIAEEVRRSDAQLVMLGRGRHGIGIGRDVLEVCRVPLLYVSAR